MRSRRRNAASVGALIAVTPIVAGGAALAGSPAPLVIATITACAATGAAAWVLKTKRLQEYADQLAKAERRYQQLMSATNDSIVVTDDRGKILEANSTFIELLDRDQSEILGHFLPDLAPATERQSIRTFISDTADAGSAEAKDIMLSQQTGDASWFDGCAVRIERTETPLVQIVLKDITASKRQFILTEKEISFIHELSRTLPLLQDFDQMLDRILSMLSDALPFEGFALVLAEPNDTMATICLSPQADSGFVTEVKDCVKEILDDISDNVELGSVDFNLEYKDDIQAAGAHVGSQIMLPLSVVNGLAGLFSSSENAFKKEDLSLFSTMVSGISSLYIAYKSYQQVQHLSVTDSLTGLYNRRKFFDELDKEVERVSRYGSPLTLIMLDIDHFKAVNDDFGHQMGDEVLKELAEILLASTRKTDICARYGGEEFIILLTETPLSGATGVARRIKAAVEETVVLGATVEIRFTASLGVTEFREGDTVDTLVGRTDEALYLAKKNGRNRIELTEASPGV